MVERKAVSAGVSHMVLEYEAEEFTELNWLRKNFSVWKTVPQLSKVEWSKAK